MRPTIMRRRMLSFALMLILTLPLLLRAAPAAAQEGDACDIDLEGLITRLTEAQQQADEEELFKAVLTLEKVEAELAGLLTACQDVSLPLPQSYTSMDDLFQFNYPEGWVVDDPEPGLFYLANSQEMLNTLSESGDFESLEPGQQVILFALPAMAGLFDEELMDFDALVEMIKEDSLNDPSVAVIGPEPVQIHRYEAQEFTVESEEADGFFTLVNFGQGAVLISVGAAASGELEEFEPVYKSVLKSIRYSDSRSLLPPGRPLDDIDYVDAIPLPDLIEEIEGTDTRSTVLAPDGSAVAWLSRQDGQAICVYTFAEAATTCTETPERFRSIPPLLLWSPDSRYIAFSEEFFRFFDEPDIWLLDVAEARIIQRTDDGVDEWQFGLGGQDSEVEGPVWLDHTFTWGPAGDLYFIRREITDPSNQDNAATGLYRLSPEDDEAELIRDLSGEMDRFSIYNLAGDYPLNGAMAVAPNGQTIAFLVREGNSDSPRNGVWTLDLSGETAPQHLLTIEELTAGLPAYILEQERTITPYGLAWAGNSQELFVLAGTTPVGGEPPFRVLSSVDPETGDLTPLVDYSGLGPDDLTGVDETNGYEGIYSLVRAAVMSPDQTTPLIFRIEEPGGRASVSALSVDQIRNEPALLYEIEEFQIIPAEAATVARDGKLLIYGYLFIPEEME